MIQMLTLYFQAAVNAASTYYMFIITDTDAVADKILTVQKHKDNNCSLYFSTYILH
jgi:hypothetical protein